MRIAVLRSVATKDLSSHPIKGASPKRSAGFLGSRLKHLSANPARFALFLAATLGCLLSLSAPAAFGQTSPPSSAPPASSVETTRNTSSASTSDTCRERDPELAAAESLLNSERPAEAEPLLRKYLQVQSDSALAHYLLGHILFAEIHAHAVLDKNSHSAIPAVDLKFRDEKAKASLAEFTEAAKHCRPQARDLKTVALDYVVLGSFVDADKWLTRALEWNPTDADVWYLLGRAKYNENRFEEAVKAFEQCLMLDTKNVKAEDNLGLSYAGLGRNDEAVAAYHLAIAWQAQFAAKNPGPYIDLSSLLIDQNRSQEAVAYLLQATEIAPRDSRARELLGKAYVRLEQLPEAQIELERAVELSPQSPNLHCMLAPVYRKEGLAEKAKSEFDRCAALTGSHSTPETPRP